jgi:hypothetical protein
MFIIDLVPLVLGDLCLYRKTIQKYQISSTRGNWRMLGPPWATWWVARPHLASANVAHLCHLTNLWEWPRNTPPSLLHHWSQVGARSRAKNVHHMDSWTHFAYVGAQMDKGVSYPHSTTPLGAPQQKRRAHSSVEGRPMPSPVARRHSVAKPPQLWTRARRHSVEQCGA